jgi:glycosyltransferase involved in cell wall biosynthesis
LPELVIHGETGLLFPVGDHAAAVEMGTGLLSDPARHRSMGAAAAVRAREFGPGEVVPAYEELYRRVLDDRGRGAALRPASVSSRE